MSRTYKKHESHWNERGKSQDEISNGRIQKSKKQQKLKTFLKKNPFCLLIGNAYKKVVGKLL